MTFLIRFRSELFPLFEAIRENGWSSWRSCSVRLYMSLGNAYSQWWRSFVGGMHVCSWSKRRAIHQINYHRTFLSVWSRAFVRKFLPLVCLMRLCLLSFIEWNSWNIIICREYYLFGFGYSLNLAIHFIMKTEGNESFFSFAGEVNFICKNFI